MKRIISLCVLCAFVGNIAAQKPTKQPSKAEMDKIMDDALKGMSKEDAAMMKEMMKQQKGKPEAEQVVDLDDILKDNKQLVPAKNTSKIIALKKKYTAAEVNSTVNSMYTKLLTKGNSAQIAMAKKAMLVAKTCTALMDAANTAMLQGQPHTALLLSLKAVQTCGINLVAQNNLAALLTQYGYPEQAIPFLQKINEEDKGNSSILNNLAYAWLGLGDTEKAYHFAGASVRQNPQHPQSRLLCGIILEKEGKTTEAKQQIEIARKFNSSKLSEQISKNSGNKNEPVKMSWAELKKKISVYEYFPKGWRKTYEAQQNNVAYRNAYQSGRLSDQRMREAFSKKLNEIIKAKNIIVDAEMDNMSLMLKKTMQGADQASLLEISVNVRHTLFLAFLEESERWKAQIPTFSKYSDKLFEGRFDGFVKCEVKAHKHPDVCPPNGHALSICRQNQATWAANCNKMMQNCNPKWLAFKDDFEEEIRFYYNALLTWTLLGNTPALEKGTEIAAIEIVESYFDSNYGLNLDLDRSYFQPAPYGCGEASQNAVETVLPLPQIPNLNCLVIFKIPSGFGSVDFSNKGFSASDNEYGITASSSTKSSNMSTSLATSGSRVSEPGLNKDPYTNTSNGNTEPVLGTPDDDELTPLPKQNKNTTDDDELMPIPKPSEVNSSWDDDKLEPLISDKDRDLRDARRAARELMENAMSTSCNPQLTKAEKKNKRFVELSEKLSREIDQQEQRQQEERKRQEAMDDELTPLPKMDDDELMPLPRPKQTDAGIKQKFTEIRTALKEATNNLGLTQTLNNGLSLPGKIAGFVTGLFN
jgi:tetratricopeptide (TPR) repeat protein